MDVKQGQNKEGKTVLYLVFEYMDTDLKKFIRSYRQTGDIPPNIIKVFISEPCESLICMKFLSLFALFTEDFLILDNKVSTNGK